MTHAQHDGQKGQEDHGQKNIHLGVSILIRSTELSRRKEELSKEPSKARETVSKMSASVGQPSKESYDGIIKVDSAAFTKDGPVSCA